MPHQLLTTEHYSDTDRRECSEFPPIVNVDNRTTLNPLLTSSTSPIDDEAELQRGQHGGESLTIPYISTRLTTTTDSPEEGKDELCPPDGQATVFFAAVADPIVPHHVPRLSLPSRLRKLKPAPIIVDHELGHGHKEQPKQETTEGDSQRELTMLTQPGNILCTSFPTQKMSPEVLTHPEGHLSPSITTKTPAFILVYGPVATRKPSNPLHPFEYHVYLHYIPSKPVLSHMETFRTHRLRT